MAGGCWVVGGRGGRKRREEEDGGRGGRAPVWPFFLPPVSILPGISELKILAKIHTIHTNSAIYYCTVYDKYQKKTPQNTSDIFLI